MDSQRFSIDLGALAKVVDEARREQASNLAQIRRCQDQIRDFEARNRSLDKLIEGASGMLPEPEQPPVVDGEASTAPPDCSADPGSDPMWKGVLAVFTAKGEAMTAPEVTRALRDLGWRVEIDRSGVETVRACLIQKGEMFHRIRTGYYGLREWPADEEKAA